MLNWLDHVGMITAADGRVAPCPHHQLTRGLKTMAHKTMTTIPHQHSIVECYGLGVRGYVLKREPDHCGCILVRWFDKERDSSIAVTLEHPSNLVLVSN